MSDANLDSDAAPNSGTDTAGVKEVTFVGWEPGVEDKIPRKHAPRLHHKKSRAGCQQCRARRVKCDEVHPVCGSCERHKSTCVWGRDKSSTRSGEPEASMSRAYDMRPKNAAPQIFGAPEIPESKERRLTELTLLHHYQTVTSYTVNRPDQYTKEWSIKIPRLAFKHDALLYAIYTCASLHLASLEPQEPKHVENYQKYLGLCLRLHRDDVAKLSTAANADAAMMTSTILRVCTFALLQERVLEPYIPPIEWLHMNSGTGHGLAVTSWKYIKDDPNSIMRGLMANVPGLSKDSKWLRDDDLIFKESNRKELNHLLRRTPENEINEIWNEEVQTAISTTVSYVGAVLEAIAAREGEAMVFRRLILFPTVVEKSFIALIEERNPRALVVLAHYFALLTRFSDFWWIGQLGPREVRAIQRHLGNEWQDLMVWPMKTIEEGPAILQPVPPE